MNQESSPSTRREGLALWIQAIAATISSVAAVVALLFVVTQLQFAKVQFLEYKTERKHDNMEKLYNEWMSPTMLYYRSKAAESYPQRNPYIVEVFNFFERLARAKANGIISVDDLTYYFQDDLLDYWCGWEQWVHENRRRNGEDSNTGELWRGTENLVQDIKAQKKLNWA